MFAFFEEAVSPDKKWPLILLGVVVVAVTDCSVMTKVGGVHYYLGSD